MLTECLPPSLTWRPLNFSSGLSTRGRLRRGRPMAVSGRCGGGGVGTAIWVGWKLLITHDTWWSEEERSVPLQYRDGWFSSLLNALSAMRKYNEESTYSMSGRIKTERRNKTWEEACKESCSLRGEIHRALWQRNQLIYFHLLYKIVCPLSKRLLSVHALTLSLALTLIKPSTLNNKEKINETIKQTKQL